MRLERPFVFGLDHLRGDLEGVIDVAVFLFDHLFAHGRLADVIVQRCLLNERVRTLRPFHFQFFGGFDRAPLLVGDDAEEALVPDDLRAGDILDGGFVDLHRHGACDGRTDHASMHHARHFHVGAEVFDGEDFRRDVVALDRLANDLVFARLLRLRLARRVQRVAVLLVPVELDVEVLAADHLRIGNALGLVVGGADHAVGNGELVGRHGQQARRHLDQHAAGFRRCHAHLLAAELNARGARGAALVYRRAGVAHVDFDGLERHVEFFRHHLRDGDVEPVAHVHLAEEGRDAAVGVDRDVGRQLIRRQRWLCSLSKSSLHRQHAVERHRRADRDDQRAAAHQDGAAGEGRGGFEFCHGALLNPSSSRRA